MYTMLEARPVCNDAQRASPLSVQDFRSQRAERHPSRLMCLPERPPWNCRLHGSYQRMGVAEVRPVARSQIGAVI